MPDHHAGHQFGTMEAGVEAERGGVSAGARVVIQVGEEDVLIVHQQGNSIEHLVTDGRGLCYRVLRNGEPNQVDSWVSDVVDRVRNLLADGVADHECIWRIEGRTRVCLPGSTRSKGLRRLVRA